MNAYCWLATAVCITGTVINVKRGNSCFLFWLVGEVMWTAYDITLGLWSRTLLDMLGLALAAWGAYENIWKNRRNAK